MSQKYRIVIFLLMLLSLNSNLAQQSYNNCSSAHELCPGNTYSVNNIDANVTFCPDCEDDFTDCFNLENTIWLRFTTNSTGGNVDVSFSNLVFQTNPGQGNTINAQIIQAMVPCDASTYTSIGNCENGMNAPFILNGIALNPVTTYFVLISGSMGTTDAAECTFDVQISGTGVDQLNSSISIDIPSSSVCLNEQVTLTAQLIDCPENTDYNWYINGVLSAVTSNPLFQTTALQDGDVVTVSTNCYSLCPITITSSSPTISVYSFLVDAGTDIYANSGETVQLNGNTTGTSFQWSPGSAVSNPFTLSPFVTPFQTTIYTLSATQNGCTLNDQVSVIIDESLEIPNTFSPNNDGNNDAWVIRGIEKYPNNLVKIYNRWGQEVFSTSGYSKEKAWDGNIRNGKASEGVYYYVIQLRDQEKQEFNGYVNLIR